MDKINEIFIKARDFGELVPRGPSIGSFWTVETMLIPGIDDLRVQLMDEGYTIAINTPVLRVYDSGGKVTYDRGTEEDLNALYEKVVALR